MSKRHFPSSSAQAFSYTLRSRGAKQKRHVYDPKYHPMDDSVRPSQAAKRRLAQRESIPISHDSSADYSEHVETSTDGVDIVDGASDEDEVEGMDASRQTLKSRKRRRTTLLAPKAVRRTTHKLPEQNMSFNIAIHPPDDDLLLSTAVDADINYCKWKRAKILCPLPEADYGLESEDDVLDHESSLSRETSLERPLQLSPKEVVVPHGTSIL